MSHLKKIEYLLSLNIAQFKGAVKKVDREFTRVVRSGQAFRHTLRDLDGSANKFRSTILGLGAAISGGAVFGAATRAAFGFNQTLEQSKIGIAALVRTFKGVDMEQSFTMAADIQKRLQIAGLKTTATYEELLKALQEGIGPALRENFDPKQIVSFTSSMTQAAAALALPMDQLGQELRAILDGTIDNNARIAKALQIDPAQVKQWKEAGTLFVNLQKRLKAFAAAGDQAANTFGGAFSNMQDAIQMALGQGTQKSFNATTAAIQRLTKSIVTIDEQAGTFTFNKNIMAALDAIDKRISSFLDSLTADDIASALENMIKTGGVIVDVLGNFAGAIMTIVDVMGPWAPMIAKVAGNLLLFSMALKTIGFVFLEPYRLIKGFGAAFTLLKDLQMVSFLGSLRTAFVEAASGVTAMSIAFKGFLALAAAEAVIKIGRLIALLWDWKKATDELTTAQARVKAQKDWIDPQIAARLAEINTALGTNYQTMDELFQAQKEGKVAYDELTGTWVRGAKEMAAATTQSAAAQQQVTGKALDVMKRKYQEYADQVKRIQDEIAGRERSLAEQLRAMSRTGMSDIGAWQDRKKEAQEYEAAAKKAAEAGNFKEAVQLADKAKTAYADLNKEIKTGDQVLVSSQQALQTSMAGVKSSGELAIDILKHQQAAAAAAMDELTGKSGFQDLSKGMEESKRKWLKNWQNMSSATMKELGKVEQKIVKITKDRHMTIYVNEVVKKSAGGLIKKFASGGKLAGYGGGDRIPALLEAGEFVIRKEAVARFGAGILNAMNSLQLPELPKFATGGQVAMASAGGETVNINLTLPTANGPVAVQADRYNATKLLQDVQRMQRLRSA